MSNKRMTGQGFRYRAWQSCCSCLLLACASFATQAQQPVAFGKVFTSPEEREYLDYLREEFVRNSQSATFNIEEDVIPDIPVQEETQEAAPEITEYKFGGIMTGVNGSRMIWLNGRRVAERDLPGSMSLASTGSGNLLNISANGTLYQLKPGQTLNVQAGSVTDSYQSSGSRPAPAQRAPASATPPEDAGEPDSTNDAQNAEEGESGTDNTSAGNIITPGESPAVAEAETPALPDTFEEAMDLLSAGNEGVDNPAFRNALENIYEQSREEQQ